MDQDIPVQVDALFMWAMFAFGWGLSLSTYHWFANRNNWSKGEIQANQTLLAIIIGVLCMLVALGFAVARQQWSEFGGWGAIIVGLAFGFLWTALLRVYSQIALFLGPIAAVILVVIWWNR